MKRPLHLFLLFLLLAPGAWGQEASAPADLTAKVDRVWDLRLTQVASR